MVVIETVDSVFALPDGIAKVCVRERDEATSKLIDVNLLDNDATGRFLVLISQRVPTTVNTAGFIPLWSFVVGTRKRESADKIFAEISRAVFLPYTAGTVMWLDIRDVLADDVREVPAERQSGVGKGRAIDIDGTGIAAVPVAITKAAEVNATRLRAPAESPTRGWNTGGWAGNGAEWWASAQQRGEVSAGATFNINSAPAHWSATSVDVSVEAVRAALSREVQNVPYSTAAVQQIGRAGNTPDNPSAASLE